jgi:hypothetical protein
VLIIPKSQPLINNKTSSTTTKTKNININNTSTNNNNFINETRSHQALHNNINNNQRRPDQQDEARIMSVNRKSNGWINWRNSAARAILLQDLEPGGLLNEMDHVPAEEVFNFYKDSPGFENVTFDQFKDRLSDHRKQALRDRKYAERDAEACRVDRLVHPRQTTNPRGELVFDIHPAKRLLRMDIANGLHKSMSPSELQATRPAYGEFKLRVFKHRIYQEVRRTKFLRWLEIQRNKNIPTPPTNNDQSTAEEPCSTNMVVETAVELARPISSKSVRGRKRVD